MDYQHILITTDTAQALVWEHYGISCRDIKSLDGEIDFNFKITNNEGQKFTVKISRPHTDIAWIKFQHDIIEHMVASDLPFMLPQTILDLHGQAYVTLTDGRYLRVLLWIDGSTMANINPHHTKTLSSWGATAGAISKALQGYTHPHAHKTFKWNPSELLNLKSHLEYINDSRQLDIAHYYIGLFEDHVVPLFGKLRKSINHNDLHELNVLASYDEHIAQVCGVIDFGDALYTETINELAITCAYACMSKSDPLATAKIIVQSYHQVFPLEEIELQVLFILINARLLITVLNAAHNAHQEPDNTYLQISAQPAWDLLSKFKDFHPTLAACHFRDACGLSPYVGRELFDRWLTDHKDAFANVIDLNDKKLHCLDLSVGSLELGNNPIFEDVPLFKKHVTRTLEDAECDIAIGGYAEIRPIYTSDAYQVNEDTGPQWRTAHIGLDLWTLADTEVFAPLDGTVFAIIDNEGDRNYGPTLILEHSVDDILTFYTLYGHLSHQSLSHIHTGHKVKKGEHIAWIGDAPGNGNWPPHLHFQVILDMIGWTSDFPGVCRHADLNVMKSLCPDPILLLNIDQKLAWPVAISKEDILAYRKKHLGSSLSISYDNPLHITRGYMQYLYDETGRKYLDTINNVAHVGHEHPKVVRAATQQIALLNTNTRYLHTQITDLAEKLLSSFPPELSIVHFVNSGSEANELALRMAKVYTQQKDILCVEVGYHGSTGACVDVSSYKFDGNGGQGAPEYTHVCPIPDSYRGMYRGEKTGELYAAHIQQHITHIQSQGRNIAAFICESILSCGGQVVLPDNYLARAMQYVTAAGGVNIIDEVQTGIGRVGSHFWGFELYDVTPDIVTIGKPLGNGHPLAAVVTTRAIADAFNNGMEYFSTFGGNPVSCAIGTVVLDLVQEEQLQTHAQMMGLYLTSKLIKLQSQHSIIGDVRGHGLFLGFELVQDQASKTPATKKANYFINRMQQLGFLMSSDGPHHNVIKIKPPMCITRDNIDLLTHYMDVVLKEDYLQLH